MYLPLILMQTEGHIGQGDLVADEVERLACSIPLHHHRITQVLIA